MSSSSKSKSPEKVFVLLSGGIDSSSALGIARQEFPEAEFEAVTIDYGQRHKLEIQAAEEVAAHFHVPHITIDAKGFMEGMLVDKGPTANEVIPEVSYAELPEGISPTYVTFRNGLMLSILAARAQAWVMQKQQEYEDQKKDWGIEEHSGNPPTIEPNAYIFLGIHADDGTNWAYPDCTQEFIGPMSAAIYIGTYNRVRVRAPFTFHNKATVVALGEAAGVPWEKTWSCYKGESLQCGVCPTCRSRKEAFEILQQGGMDITDPTEYQQ